MTQEDRAGGIPPVRIAALLIGLEGLLGILYAGLLPLLPPIVNVPEPLVSTVIASLGLVAAVGLWRWQTWGRWLGIVVTLWSVARTLGAIAILVGIGPASGTAPDPLLDVIVPLTIDAIILVVLATRWPELPQPDGSP
jgi:hypothetical protein